MKRSLTTAPTLAYPDPSKPYVLYTDASDECVGALLVQDSEEGERPIYYLSHRLSETQTRWPVVERECFALIYSLEKLNHYLQGAKFIVKTDHKPLKYLLTSEMKNRIFLMWALKIGAYDCKIEYLDGRKNTRADMLSRLPAAELISSQPS